MSLCLWQVPLDHELLFELLLVAVDLIEVLQDAWPAVGVKAISVSLDCVITWVVMVCGHGVMVVVEHAVAHESAVVDHGLRDLEDAEVIEEIELASSLRIWDE